MENFYITINKKTYDDDIKKIGFFSSFIGQCNTGMGNSAVSQPQVSQVQVRLEFGTRGCTATRHRGVAGFHGVVSSLPAKVKVSNGLSYYYLYFKLYFLIFYHYCFR